jgi:hypothetical protein
LNAFLRGSLRTLRDIGWFALGWCSRVSPSGKLWQFKNIRGFGRLFAPVCAYLRLKLTAVRVSRMGRSSLVTEITVNYAYLRQITVNYGSFVAAQASLRGGHCGRYGHCGRWSGLNEL